MDQLTVSATANGLNYLPEYLADHIGLFAKRDLQVTTVACDPWTGVLDDLASGAADIALGGLWVPAMYANGPRRFSVFCQLNNQFPMGIVLRKPASGEFSLSDLEGKVVLAPGAGGSAPYEFTAGLLREAGVDVAAIRFLRDLSTAMLVELFQAGTGDAIIADLVTAKGLEASGHGAIVFRHLDGGGTMPNSVYYCETARMEEISDRAGRFTAAVAEAMELLPTVEDSVIDETLLARWPDGDLEVLRSAVAEMKASEVWATTVVDRAACDRWSGILADGGLVTSAPSYDTLIDERFSATVSS